MLVNINPNEKPLCMNMKDPLHQLHTAIIDIISRHAEQDENGEFVNPESENIYRAAAYGNYDGRMYLYAEAVSPLSMIREGKSVQTYYFRCFTCGFTVPAQAGNW